MAQLRPEVRPDVTNMPVDGFLMQTGGSAKRRVVPFDTSMSSYKVTGVPGHTHNCSAVCSVLVDNTEKSNVAFTISEHFGNAEVVHAVNDENGLLIGRYTDSAVVDEADYDRAIERGIGEIAIIPENCHQEIREPVRDIYELRTLVTPKDKLDTLTYVEEVGGFVDQTTGEVPDPEPLYPDVQVDLLFDYDDPVDAAAQVAWVDGNNNAAGTGNRQGVGIATEFRFEGDWSTANFSRDANGQGNGTSFAVLVRAGVPFAQAHGADWSGSITMQWDPNERHYFCPSFEVIFDRVREVENTVANGAEISAVQESFEVQFPRISTQTSADGQCVFASGDRPLTDGGTPVPLLCTVNQYNLIKGVKDSQIKFWARPFRVATGYPSALYGAGKTVSYFERVRNTEIRALAQHTKQIATAADQYFNDGVDNTQLQSVVRLLYHTGASVHFGEGLLPTVNARNELAGTAWYGLPDAVTDVPSGFGTTFTVTGAGPPGARRPHESPDRHREREPGVPVPAGRDPEHGAVHGGPNGCVRSGRAEHSGHRCRPRHLEHRAPGRHAASGAAYVRF